MTKRVNTPRAHARRDTTPKPKTRAYKKHGADTAPKIETARKYMNTGSYASAALVSADKPLTEKQKIFVKFWAEGDSIQSASRRAGYSSDAIPYRMTLMPNILALKAKLSKEYEDAVHMTKKRVMEMHLEAFEMAKLMSEPATMVSAAREVGKLCNYYAPVEHRVNIDVTGNVILDRMNSMSDAELLKVISQGTAAAEPLLLESITYGDDEGS